MLVGRGREAEGVVYGIRDMIASHTQIEVQESFMDAAIGELHFHQAGRELTARLESDLTWTCNDEAIEEFLNTACRCVNGQRWEVHRPAVHTLYQAAERLGAEVCVPAAG